MPGLMLKPPTTAPLPVGAPPDEDPNAVDAVTGADQQAIESIGRAPVAAATPMVAPAAPVSTLPPEEEALLAPPTPVAPPVPKLPEQQQLDIYAEQAKEIADKATQAHAKAAAEAQAARDLAAQEKAQAAERAALTEKLAPIVAAKMKARDEAIDRASAAHINSYWTNKTVADQIQVGVGLLASGWAQGLSAVGGNPNTQNVALKLLTDDMDRDFARQQAEIANLRETEKMRRTGLIDAQAANAKMMDALKTHQLAARQAVIDELSAKMKSFGATDADIEANEALTALKQKQLDAKRAVDRQDAADAEKKLRDQAQAEKDRAEAELARVKAKAGGFAPRKGAGAGGGGAAVTGDAVGKLKTAIENGVDGRPLGAGEIQKIADGLGIPAYAKAGRPSVDAITKSVAFVAGQGTKKAAADNKLQKQIDTETQAWAKENGINDIAKKQRELSAVLDEVKNAPHNPLQQALAVEKAVSSARGGAASKQALALALHHLGGKWDSIEAFVQGARDGELGEKQMQNFIGFMTNQLGTAQKEGKDAYDNYGKYVEAQPAEKRAGLLAARGQLFSGLHGFGGKESPLAPIGPPADLIAKARAEVANGGPHAASAQRLLDHYGVK